MMRLKLGFRHRHHLTDSGKRCLFGPANTAAHGRQFPVPSSRLWSGGTTSRGRLGPRGIQSPFAEMNLHRTIPISLSPEGPRSLGEGRRGVYDGLRRWWGTRNWGYEGISEDSLATISISSTDDAKGQSGRLVSTTSRPKPASQGLLTTRL
ncbi:hypothetical protein BC936DRAFT_148516 [Jimgerdemannia flammicorona]|uniref:Uncharacterized protein n=1 Tax=Jimgerdemannia flammicorona TaxID=994334 RepID=A0A433D2V5_9FUNG|nr:hypothetical protein BC936DRAFT_148516 [Jimgerdemannia flammicorona]